MDNTEKLTTIRLGGQLGKRFGRVYRFYVSSPAEAIRALSSQIEGFAAYLADEKRQTKYKVFVAEEQIDPEKDLHNLCGSKEIRIAPVIQGAKNGGIFQAVLGVALIALAFIPGVGTAAATGAFTAFGGAAFSAGVSLALGGIAQMLSPQPTMDIQESPNNEPNTSLGVTNVTAQGRGVPLILGEAIVGSAVISAGIYASDTNG